MRSKKWKWKRISKARADREKFDYRGGWIHGAVSEGSLLASRQRRSGTRHFRASRAMDQRRLRALRCSRLRSFSQADIGIQAGPYISFGGSKLSDRFPRKAPRDGGEQPVRDH